jgi:hypothetical protein
VAGAAIRAAGAGRREQSARSRDGACATRRCDRTGASPTTSRGLEARPSASHREDLTDASGPTPGRCYEGPLDAAGNAPERPLRTQPRRGRSTRLRAPCRCPRRPSDRGQVGVSTAPAESPRTYTPRPSPTPIRELLCASRRRSRRSLADGRNNSFGEPLPAPSEASMRAASQASRGR